MSDKFFDKYGFVFVLIGTCAVCFFLIVMIQFHCMMFDAMDDLECRIEKCEKFLQIEP